MRIFPAFFDKPTGMRYLEQNSDEVIELLLRKDPVTNIPWIASSIILFFLPFLAASFSQYFNLNLTATLPGTIGLEMLILYYLLIIIYATQSFLYWYFNIYVITNQHLVEIRFDSILSRSITEIQYDEIESVTSKVQGVLSEVFNYGKVIIETAARDEDIEYTNIPEPDQVADRIRDIQQKAG